MNDEQQTPNGKRIILVKYSEIALKGKNRSDFERRLVENMARATGLEKSRFERRRGRIAISNIGEQEVVHARRALTKVFGVHSFAVAEAVEPDLEIIGDAALEGVHLGGARTFRVDARRADKKAEFNSKEINETVGQRINDAFNELNVNLDAPDLTVFVEVHADAAYVYTDRDEERGPGGLPVGSSGFGLALISGGIDSPVAAWRVMKRGMSVDGVYFHSFPHTGEKSKEKVVDEMRVLAAWNARQVRLFAVPFADIQNHIAEHAPEPYWTVLFRRSMQRISERIAHERGYEVTINGDNLAQVASQTPENMNAIDEAAEMTVLRPLVGADKNETIMLAKRIGTFDISTRPFEDCCTVFTPSKPKTKANRERVAEIDARLALAELESSAAENAEMYRVSSDRVEREAAAVQI